MSLLTTLHSLQSIKCDVSWELTSSLIGQEGIAISKLPHLLSANMTYSCKLEKCGCCKSKRNPVAHLTIQYNRPTFTILLYPMDQPTASQRPCGKLKSPIPASLSNI